jgi:Mn-dependent DtxR family transcriptional regulator
MAARPSQSAEDYLERIHELIQEKGYARAVDIAHSLKVRQASVTAMVQKLAKEGYLQYEKYRGILITPKGREVACHIGQRHATLEHFFTLLGIAPATRHQDIEGIEHHLSRETVERIAGLAAFLEENPATLKKFLVRWSDRAANP